MNKNQIQVFRTAQATGERLTALQPLTFVPADAAPPATVAVDSAVTYQTILGFGGAFTESVAVTLNKLPPAQQAEVLNAYFHPTAGHGYTLCRTHINSCDFSLNNYAYTEVAGDVHLEHFSIERDRQALIPLIKAAQTVAEQPLQLLASPWSPPAWMKTNGEMNHGGKLRPEYRQTWAEYYCRYLEAYAREGLSIWGFTVQNEPEAIQTWPSCLYTAEEERDFVRDYLGPTLARHGHRDVRLIIWDHNRDRIFERAQVVFDDSIAAQVVWGTGFHWYEKPQRFDNVQRVHDAYPDKHLLFTEGCQESGPHLGEWGLGERYAHAMLHDLNAWTEGWIDWNLLLDENGGPNQVGNFCSAPIIADTRTGELFYQSSYYYVGHFARFIRPGARRIRCAVTAPPLEASAFLNLDHTVAVVVLNRTAAARDFALAFNGALAHTTSPAHSIITFKFESPQAK